MGNLRYEDKINLFNDYEKGISISSLSKKYNKRKSGITYLIKLINIHGFDTIKKTKNRTYSKEFKQEAIDRVLVNNESVWTVALDIELSSDGMLQNWIKNYKDMDYNIKVLNKVCLEKEIVWIME